MKNFQLLLLLCSFFSFFAAEEDCGCTTVVSTSTTSSWDSASSTYATNVILVTDISYTEVTTAVTTTVPASTPFTTATVIVTASSSSSEQHTWQDWTGSSSQSPAPSTSVQSSPSASSIDSSSTVGTTSAVGTSSAPTTTAPTSGSGTSESFTSTPGATTAAGTSSVATTEQTSAGTPVSSPIPSSSAPPNSPIVSVSTGSVTNTVTNYIPENGSTRTEMSIETHQTIATTTISGNTTPAGTTQVGTTATASTGSTGSATSQSAVPLPNSISEVSTLTAGQTFSSAGSTFSVVTSELTSTSQSVVSYTSSGTVYSSTSVGTMVSTTSLAQPITPNAPSSISNSSSVGTTTSAVGSSSSTSGTIPPPTVSATNSSTVSTPDTSINTVSSSSSAPPNSNSTTASSNPVSSTSPSSSAGTTTSVGSSSSTSSLQTSSSSGTAASSTAQTTTSTDGSSSSTGQSSSTSSSPSTTTTGSSTCEVSEFGVPTDYNDPSGTLTGTTTVGGTTFAITSTEETYTKTGTDCNGQTVTVSYIATVYVPSVVGDNAQTAPTGGTSTLTGATSTTCSLTDSFNIFKRTTDCDLKAKWTDKTVSVQPWCTAGKCLCPACTLPLGECFHVPAPTPNNCASGWLCPKDNGDPSSLGFDTTPAPQASAYATCAPTWNSVVQCVTAKDQQSCSSVTWTAEISHSTSRASDGSVWIFPMYVWGCSDALCRADTFKLPWPFSWIKFLASCSNIWRCITWFLHGIWPPAPRFTLDFPPVGPPGSVDDLKPTCSGKCGDETESISTSTSSCSSQTYTMATVVCTPVTVPAGTTSSLSQSCTTTTTPVVTCGGQDSTITTTQPCSTITATYTSSSCSSGNNACVTTTWTSEGCSASVCSLTTSLDTSAADSTVDAWISSASFTPYTASSAIVTQCGTTSTATLWPVPSLITTGGSSSWTSTWSTVNPPNGTCNATVTSTSTDIPADVSASAASVISSDATAYSASITSTSTSSSSTSSTTTKQSPTVTSSSSTSASTGSVFSFSGTSFVPSADPSFSSALASQSASQASSALEAAATERAFPNDWLHGANFKSPETVPMAPFVGALLDVDNPDNWPSDRNLSWFHVNYRKQDAQYMKDNFVKTLFAVCGKLRDNANNWNPGTGWYFTWDKDNGFGNGQDTPAWNGNITFSVEFRTDEQIWFDCYPLLSQDDHNKAFDECRNKCYKNPDKTGKGVIDDDSCPPPKDGKVPIHFWRLEDDFEGRCTDRFWRALQSSFVIADKQPGYVGWTVGGSFIDNGFIWTVFASNPSPYYYWPHNGNGNEDVPLDIDSVNNAKKLVDLGELYDGAGPPAAAAMANLPDFTTNQTFTEATNLTSRYKAKNIAKHIVSKKWLW